MQQIEIRGQTVELLPEKLAFLPQQKTLLVADAHFGKAATFRRAGIPVPAGTTATMLDRLTNIIHRTAAVRLIFLGDFLHSSTQTQVDFVDDLKAWQAKHSTLNLVLVPGNHDRGFQKLADELQIKVQPEPFVDGPFSYCHFHQAGTDVDQFSFAGHIHPAVAIYESANNPLRVPCFAIADDFIILPAFGEFTGNHVIKHSDYLRVLAVTDSRLIEITPAMSRSPNQRSR